MQELAGPVYDHLDVAAQLESCSSGEASDFLGLTSRALNTLPLSENIEMEVVALKESGADQFGKIVALESHERGLFD